MNELIDALNNNYKNNQEIFEKAICDFVRKNMNNITQNQNNICKVENTSAYGSALYSDEEKSYKIILSNQLIEDLLNGKLHPLYTIFHELTHVAQFYAIDHQINLPNIKVYIKDLLMSTYIDSENEKFNFCASYYKDNYLCDSMEYDATICGLEFAKRFLDENNIKYSKEGFEQLEKETQNKTKTLKRDLSSCITYNDNLLSLNDAFDIAIEKHPEWLDLYPQLNDEYIFTSGKIIKIEKFKNNNR